MVAKRIISIMATLVYNGQWFPSCGLQSKCGPSSL